MNGQALHCPLTPYMSIESILVYGVKKIKGGGGARRGLIPFCMHFYVTFP
jgi:hypothetical protein